MDIISLVDPQYAGDAIWNTDYQSTESPQIGSADLDLECLVSSKLSDSPGPSVTNLGQDALLTATPDNLMQPVPYVGSVLDGDADTIIDAWRGIPISLVTPLYKDTTTSDGFSDLPATLLSQMTGRRDINGCPQLNWRCYISGCNRESTRRDHAMDHARMHFNDRRWRCDLCSKAFFRAHELKRHVNGHTKRSIRRRAHESHRQDLQKEAQGLFPLPCSIPDQSERHSSPVETSVEWVTEFEKSVDLALCRGAMTSVATLNRVI